MNWLLPDNWGEVFALGIPLLESVLRGVLIYAGLIVLLRVLPRREAGALSLTDLLLANLVIEAISNGLQGENRTVPSALVSAATVLLCAFAVDWLSARSCWCRRLLQSDPVPLVRDGRLQRTNLHQELITREDLAAKARLEGLEGIDEIKHATLEPEGQISIIPREVDTKGGRAKRPARSEPPPRGREETLERLWVLQRKLAAQQAKIETALQEMMLQAKS